MDYVKIVKESFAGWNNKEVWGWSIGATVLPIVVFGILVLADLMMFGSGILVSFLSGNISSLGSAIAEIIVLYLLYILACVIIGLVLSGKLITIAMKRVGMPAREFNSKSVSGYIGLGLLHCAVFMIAIIAMLIVWIGAAMLAAAIGAVSPPPLIALQGELNGIIVWTAFEALYLLRFIGLAAVVIVSFAGLVYLFARLSMTCIFFWKKEGCGIVEAVKASWEFTRGKCVSIVIASIALFAVIMAVFLVLFIFMMIPLCEIVFLIPYIAFAIGMQAVWPYAMVELYSQLTSKEGKCAGKKKPALWQKNGPAKKIPAARKGKK